MQKFNYTGRINREDPLLIIRKATPRNIFFNAVAKNTIFTEEIRKKYPCMSIRYNALIPRISMILIKEEQRHSPLLCAARLHFRHEKLVCTLRGDILLGFFHTHGDNVYFRLKQISEIEYQLVLDAVNKNTTNGIGRNDRNSIFDISPQRLTFFEQLPMLFERKDAIATGSLLNISERAVDKYLKLFLQKELIIKTTYGQYSKR